MRILSALLAALLIAACSREEPQLLQCRKVIEHFIAVEKIVAIDEVADDEGFAWLFELQVQSALGPKPGQASCHYARNSIGQLADRPYRIVLGKTAFTSEKDLEALLALRKP